MPTTNTNQSDDGIVERLLRTKKQVRVDHAFGGLIAIPDENETREVPINPDGPKAATYIATLEARLAAVEGEKAKVKADAIELCAFAADGLAEMARAGGITGRSDPLEATLLDEQFSQFAADLRRQKPQALGASL